MTNKITEFHSIMPISNIPSVLQRGILSYLQASKLPHADISMHEVQERRDRARILGGSTLHSYANVYFHARNPMMYKRQNNAEQLCVLRVSTEILKIQGVVVADQNAASDYVRFLTPCDIPLLNLDMIFADDWTHSNDKIAYLRHKSMKCAEVLVPNCIGVEYIVGAYVVNDVVAAKMRTTGFVKAIEVNPNLFFK